MLPKIFNRPATTAGGIRDGRYVVIDWNDLSIGVHEMTLHRGSANIARSFFREWPTGMTSVAATDQAAEWLQQQLLEHGITAAEAVVSVPRRQVSLRLLEFPRVDDDELASLIEMQMESQGDPGAAEQAFDFLPQPSLNRSTHRHALLATIASATLHHIGSVIAGAGLNLKATCVGELSVDALHTDIEEDGLTLSLLLNRAKAEFVVSHAGVALAAHSARMPAETPSTLARTMPAVVARMVAGLPEAFQSMSLSQINLLGPFAPQLQAGIERLKICDVRVIRVGNEDAVRAVAVLQSLTGGMAAVNFANRKRPVDVKQMRRRQWMRYGVGVAVLLGLMSLWQHAEKQSLSTQLATLTKAKAGLEELNQRGATTLQQWKFVSNWQSSAVNWSTEIKDFAGYLPKTGEAYLTRLQVEQPAGSKTPIIRADGIAKNSETAMSINRSLMAGDSKYELQPHGIEPAMRDADFRSSFQVEAAINIQAVRAAREN